MKITLELLIFCGVFMLMVKLGTGNTGLNSLYFYPEEYKNIAYQRGLADPEKVAKAKKSFMLVFIPVLLGMLVIIIHINKVHSFSVNVYEFENLTYYIKRIIYARN